LRGASLCVRFDCRSILDSDVMCNSKFFHAAVEVEFDTFLASNADPPYRTAASTSFATDMIWFARFRPGAAGHMFTSQ